MNEMMLKIGKFARLGQVSIATLRYYDQYGLLKPSALDPETGYRYYALDQLPRLNRILALKDLGFPLEQVTRILEEDLSLAQLREMFQLKQTFIQQVIDAEQTRLQRVAARLRQIEQEERMPGYDVLLKQVEPVLVAAVRDRIPAINEREALYAKLSDYLEHQCVAYIPHVQPDLLILHSKHEMDTYGMSIDVEVAVPLARVLQASEQVQVYTLPAALVASTVHTGNDVMLGRAYMSLQRWIGENGYRMSGPARLVHLQRMSDLHSGHHVTEVQMPVCK